MKDFKILKTSDPRYMGKTYVVDIFSGQSSSEILLGFWQRAEIDVIVTKNDEPCLEGVERTKADIDQSGIRELPIKVRIIDNVGTDNYFHIFRLKIGARRLQFSRSKKLNISVTNRNTGEIICRHEISVRRKGLRDWMNQPVNELA